MPSANGLEVGVDGAGDVYAAGTFTSTIDVDQTGSVFATGPFRGTQDMDPGPSTFEITGQDSTGSYRFIGLPPAAAWSLKP
jgi:hypothetical protein